MTAGQKSMIPVLSLAIPAWVQHISHCLCCPCCHNIHSAHLQLADIKINVKLVIEVGILIASYCCTLSTASYLDTHSLCLATQICRMSSDSSDVELLAESSSSTGRHVRKRRQSTAVSRLMKIAREFSLFIL